MTVHFEDLPLADMMAAFDAKIASQEGKPRESTIDSDTVARARAQLAAAEAEARRRAEPAGEAAVENIGARRAVPVAVDGAVRAVIAALRGLLAEGDFMETLRQRATRHLPADEPPEPQPWVALGLTRDVWARLKKAGKLKED